MWLKNSADYRTLLWVTMAATLVVVQFAWPSTVLYVLPFSCYLGIACGVIAHNHNHRPIFISRRANHFFGHVLTIFYGYPTLMWVPTHNINHHHFVNRPGDATITWRHTNRHNLLVAATYFFVSGYFQSESIQDYIRAAKDGNRRLYARIRFQYGVWAVFFAAALGVAVMLHHRERLGFIVWFCALVLPALCSISVIMFFNYIQHVHADAWSKNDHSRNFTSKTFNFFFFNNGYHTAHHHYPGLHWSALPAVHGQMARAIHPSLNERSLAWFLVRQYLLAPLIPSLGTRQLGPEPGPLPSTRAAELPTSTSLPHHATKVTATRPTESIPDRDAVAVSPAVS
jgi:beta-carotene hydroxylase